jgi:hypothetical protein
MKPAYLPLDNEAPTRHWASFVVVMLLGLSTLSCAVFSSPGTLNDGKGTREDPVPMQVYAKTIDFDVRALSVVWMDQEAAGKSEPSDQRPLRIEIQVRCTKLNDETCDLKNIAQHIKLVDESGILYEPIFSIQLEQPLEGEVLGGAEKAGWLAYQIPRGVDVSSMVAEYGEEQLVFFNLK